MSRLEKAYLSLLRMEEKSAGAAPAIDPRVDLAVSVAYLAVMLSVPMGRLSMLIWFALYPPVASAVHGVAFGTVFRRSLFVLPLVLLIGIFNPILDHRVLFHSGGLAVTAGWISFASIALRGLLAVQAMLILIEACGFSGICRAMRRMGVPSFLTDQLQFVYRYMSVLLLEALTMRRAAEARGFGRRSFPPRVWGKLVGQLFLRSVGRAERVHRAMEARGFDGTLPQPLSGRTGIRASDLAYLICMAGAMTVMRIFDLSALFNQAA